MQDAFGRQLLVLQSQRDSLLQQLEQQKKDRSSYVDVLEEKNALEDSLRYNVAVYGCLNIANGFEGHSHLSMALLCA